MLPASFIEQWPFLAIPLGVIAFLFKLYTTLQDTRVAELKSGYEKRIESLERTINYLQGYREYADSGIKALESSVRLARQAVETPPPVEQETRKIAG